MSKSLNALHSKFKPLAEQLIANANAAGLNIVIIETTRTLAQHQENLKNGASRAKRSKHIDGLAIDIAPKVLLVIKNWAPHDLRWDILGEVGKKLGLVWGGDWKDFVDKPHFEYAKCKMQGGIWVPL